MSQSDVRCAQTYPADVQGLGRVHAKGLEVWSNWLHLACGAVPSTQDSRCGRAVLRLLPGLGTCVMKAPSAPEVLRLPGRVTVPGVSFIKWSDALDTWRHISSTPPPPLLCSLSVDQAAYGRSLGAFRTERAACTGPAPAHSGTECTGTAARGRPRRPPHTRTPPPHRPPTPTHTPFWSVAVEAGSVMGRPSASPNGLRTACDAGACRCSWRWCCRYCPRRRRRRRHADACLQWKCRGPHTGPSKPPPLRAPGPSQGPLSHCLADATASAVHAGVARAYNSPRVCAAASRAARGGRGGGWGRWAQAPAERAPWGRHSGPRPRGSETRRTPPRHSPDSVTNECHVPDDLVQAPAPVPRGHCVLQPMEGAGGM